jgi:hypothetical protein
MTSITGLPKVLVELIAEFAPKEDAFIGVDPEIVNWYVSLMADYVGRCTTCNKMSSICQCDCQCYPCEIDGGERDENCYCNACFLGMCQDCKHRQDVSECTCYQYQCKDDSDCECRVCMPCWWCIDNADKIADQFAEIEEYQSRFDNEAWQYETRMEAWQKAAMEKYEAYMEAAQSAVQTDAQYDQYLEQYDVHMEAAQAKYDAHMEAAQAKYDAHMDEDY